MTKPAIHPQLFVHYAKVMKHRNPLWAMYALNSHYETNSPIRLAFCKRAQELLEAQSSCTHNNLLVQKAVQGSELCALSKEDQEVVRSAVWQTNLVHHRKLELIPSHQMLTSSRKNHRQKRRSVCRWNTTRTKLTTTPRDSTHRMIANRWQ